MKKFSTLVEHCLTSDVNPGNSVDLGVTNHLTPINNILTNVRNLYSDVDIVAAVAEDGVSIKVHSSRFVSKEECERILYWGNIYRPALATYLYQQGLDKMQITTVSDSPANQYYVAYFSASDIKAADPTKDSTPANEPDPKNNPNPPAGDNKDNKKKKVSEDKEINGEEKEIVVNEDNNGDDDEIKDLTHGKVLELLKSKDKVKAAKQLEILVGQEVELPREFYFAGLEAKGDGGEESVALRWKYQKRVDVNATSEIVKTLIKIHEPGEKCVFVPDFDEDTMFTLPDEVKKLIENIIDFVGATPTDDKAVFSIEDAEGDGKDNKDDKTPDKKEDSEGGEDNKNNGDDLLS